MNHMHKDLAAGKWKELSFCEQMANIGSEVERAINWRAKGNAPYSQKAVDRALDLLDITLAAGVVSSHLKELARVREAVVDYFIGINQFASTDILWRNYFGHFTYAARKNH